jgi:hypothetical protein
MIGGWILIFSLILITSNANADSRPNMDFPESWGGVSSIQGRLPGCPSLNGVFSLNGTAYEMLDGIPTQQSQLGYERVKANLLLADILKKDTSEALSKSDSFVVQELSKAIKLIISSVNSESNQMVEFEVDTVKCQNGWVSFKTTNNSIGKEFSALDFLENISMGVMDDQSLLIYKKQIIKQTSFIFWTSESTTREIYVKFRRLP